MEFDKARERIPDVLEGVTRLTVETVSEAPTRGGGMWRPDLEVRAEGKIFLIEYKSRSSAESVGSALAQIGSWSLSSSSPDEILLLIVPYMGDVGRQMCESAGVDWMDLSGNASIRAPGFHIQVLGRPNKYRSRGRPRDLFARRASRITRALLTQTERGWLQHELVQTTHISKGYASKLLSRLQEAGFIEVRRDAKYWVRDFEALLDGWRKSYDFEDHTILKGFLPERTPDALVKKLVLGLSAHATATAVTGLGAAWHYTKHAGHRLSTVFVSKMPSEQAMADLGFQRVQSGANAWLVEPYDESVFIGVVSSKGVPYVSALQAYLDLSGHPERSEEAAEELRPIVVGSVR
jgi:hypothetical protein